MSMDGSLALRSPGLDHVGNQLEAGFIGKYYMGAQPRSVFFIRGQSFDRSLQKQIYQAFSLCLVQLQRTTGRVAYPQSLGSATPAGITPAHHRTGIASYASPYLVERTTRIQQRQGSLAPVLQQIGAPLQSGHRCSAPESLLLHYLCRRQ